MYCACCICSCCLFNRMCQIIKLERNDWFLSGLGCLLFCGALLFLASAVCMLLQEWHLNNLQGLLPQLVCWQGPAELLPVRLQEDESLMACKDGFNSQAAKMLSLFVSFRFPHTMDGRPKQLARYSETVSCSNGFWGTGSWRGLRACCTSRPIFASDLAPKSNLDLVVNGINVDTSIFVWLTEGYHLFTMYLSYSLVVPNPDRQHTCTLWAFVATTRASSLERQGKPCPPTIKKETHNNVTSRTDI